MAIKSSNLLPSSKSDKGGQLVVQPKINLVAKRKVVKLKKPTTTSTKETKKSYDLEKLIPDLKSIQKNLVLIDREFKKIIGTNNKILSEKEKQGKVKRRKSREDELEKQTKKEEGKAKGLGISLPKFGLFDAIKNFLFWTILGNLFFKFLTPENINKVHSAVKTIISIGSFIGKTFVKVVEGLVNFIDFSYEKFDQIRGFIKKVGGEGALKIFDQFSGMLNKVINGAIILAILLSKSKGFGGRRGGGGRGGRGGRGGEVGITGRRAGRTRAVNPAAARKYAERYGRDAAIKKFGRDGVKSLGGKYGRSTATNLARKGAVSILGKGGTKAVLKFARPFIKRLPIIGGLIDFGLSIAMGEPLGRAAFKAIGAGILGAIGTGFGGPIGAVLGGFAGDWAGGKLYDIFFGGKKGSGKTQGRVDGGLIGAYAYGGAIKQSVTAGRTLRVDKSSDELKRINVTAPRKLDPGKDVGGKDKIKELFKQNDDKNEHSPYDALVSLSEKLKRIPFIGRIMGAAIDIAMGQNVSNTFFKEISESLTSFYLNTKSKNTVTSLSSSLDNILPRLEEGGSVIKTVTEGRSLSMDSSAELKPEQIRKTLESGMRSEFQSDLNSAINVIRKQLGLKPIGEAGAGEEEGGGGGEGFEVGPAGTSGDKLTMARNLMRDLGLTAEQAAGIVGNMAAESGVENARPQGSRPGTKAPLKVDGVTGYGLVQWTSKGRQQALADFAKSRGADLSKPLSMDIEYQFFLKEFKGAYGHVLAQIKKAPDTKTASTIFMQQYEVPAGYKTEAKIMERYNMSKPIAAALGRGEGKATEGKGTYIGPAPGSGGTAGGGGGSYTQLSNNPDAKRGSKLAGELGRYLDSKGLGKWGSGVHQHPEHPPWRPESGHSPGSLHYASKGARAIDVGGYGRSRGNYSDQEQILAGVAEFNKMKGVKPVQLLKDGYPGHSDHVHIAYQGGGEIQTAANIKQPERNPNKYNNLQQYQAYGGSSTNLAVRTIVVYK